MGFWFTFVKSGKRSRLSVHAYSREEAFDMLEGMVKNKNEWALLAQREAA